jgi:hypothetical protein
MAALGTPGSGRCHTCPTYQRSGHDVRPQDFLVVRARGVAILFGALHEGLQARRAIAVSEGRSANRLAAAAFLVPAIGNCD